MSDVRWLGMSERRFIVKKEEDTFLLGHFEDEQFSGVYLSPEYLGRLRQISNAVASRLGAHGDKSLPDALKNLLGVIDRLTTAHAAQVNTENYPGSQADREEIARVEKELAELQRQLDGFPRGPNDPRRK